MHDLIRMTAAGLFALSLVATAGAEPSRMCGEITGDTDRLRTFCDRIIPASLGVERADAQASVLTLSVSRSAADAMLIDTLTAEGLILNWMRLWRAYSGSTSVTVIVRWRAVEVARGQTSLFRGDRVTFR